MTAPASLLDRIGALSAADQALVSAFIDQLEAARTRAAPPADPLSRIRARFDVARSRSDT
ncbi:hypothetical protein GCM10011390_02590 [Aureimonas endophytica]|uniref:Uncharacterized protein n=1 Tax=Aureimonas endophytica TaxID=2027858 RepID=A0A916ZCV6_9HYPH|nr:hypothetical protein [Aureimonas endophytica]GGD87357.1 hypothetical protein GCM10011390_02590 [Aureimonas endophytica]